MYVYNAYCICILHFSFSIQNRYVDNTQSYTHRTLCTVPYKRYYPTIEHSANISSHCNINVVTKHYPNLMIRVYVVTDKNV